MNRRALLSLVAALLLISQLLIPASAQSNRRSETERQRPEPERQRPESERQRSEIDRAPQSGQSAPDSSDDDGTIKIDTTLVTIPVTVLDRNGKYIPNLRKSDFQIYEDGIEQEIADFSAVEVPFHVVLMLDTSRSTVFRLEDIQRAAVTFVEQLRPDDRVMVVSFDDKIYVDTEFTSDRGRLRRAIYGTRTGGGTKLYDAVDLVITERLRQVDGRKAIVLFTDGVDTTSKFASAAANLSMVEESDILVYPIRYDTEAQMNGPTIFGGGRSRRGPVIIDQWPLPWPRGRRRPFNFDVLPFNALPQWPRGGGSEDYRRGAQYLQGLADRSGARLYQADTLQNLDQAFSLIAEELRHQYALSYYPSNAARDGSYRRIRVRARQPNLVVRTREGYRAANDGQHAAGENERDRGGRPRLARPE